jgi:hypothetical protein
VLTGSVEELTVEIHEEATGARRAEIPAGRAAD